MGNSASDPLRLCDYGLMGAISYVCLQVSRYRELIGDCETVEPLFENIQTIFLLKSLFRQAIHQAQ